MFQSDVYMKAVSESPWFTLQVYKMSSAPVPTLVPQKLGATFGALYLGGTGAAMYVSNACSFVYMPHSLSPSMCRLFGATNLQTYFYFRNYKQDMIFQKCAVIFLWYDETHG